MDKNQLLRTAVIMFLVVGLIYLWPYAVDFIGTKMGYDMTRPPIAESTTQPSTQPATTETAAATTTTSAATAPAINGMHVATTTQPAMGREIGSEIKNDPNYHLAVTISPRGAGIDAVILNQFARVARSDDRYVFQQPYPDAKDSTRPLATDSVTINGTKIDLSTADWTLEKSNDRSATFALTVDGKDGPLATIRKTFTVFPPSDPSQGYEIAVDQTFDNLTDHDLKIQTEFNGPTMPPREQDRGGERQTLGGYNVKNTIEVNHDMVESYTEKAPTKDYSKDKDGNPLLWAGTMSSYFEAIVRPLAPAGTNTLPQFIQTVTTRGVNITPDQKTEDHQVGMTLDTSEQTIHAGKSLTLPLRVYFGPRQRSILNSNYYAAFPVSYDSTLVLTSGFCGFCTFTFLVDALVWLLRIFHVVFRDWGLAIIALVVLVRVLLHPITKRSQISMAKMGKMGPEMERLRKKYADNKEELSKAMWEMQKQQGVGPYLGCAPMFLQTPIWIALWQALYTTFELRQAPFLWGFTWIHDLSKPDHLLTWSPIPLIFGWQLSALNILPILMGIVFVLQMQFQPKPMAMTPEQQQQQKMMQWLMPFMFPLMLYNGPAGLNLYIMTSTAIGLVESKIIRDHIKQKEEAEKAGRVIVDAGAKFKSSGGGLKQPEKPKSGGLFGWLQTLQEKADQIRREAEKRK